MQCFAKDVFYLSYSFYFLLPEDTASTVKFINKLMKNNTTPKRNTDAQDNTGRNTGNGIRYHHLIYSLPL